ncbi:MAG: SDR family NAD(P)-dependent oxidoreductase [Burkholderiales bacterium]|nr:SDR family NAD(P)-dependent oxidoreductase [Burkholderiales bacterium]
MSNRSNKPVCVIVGVGPGNGAAFARRFGSEGYRVALLARSTEFTMALAQEIDGARAYACDVADAASIEVAFAAIRAELGEVDTLIYNAGAGVWKNVEEITPEDFEQSWRINALGSLLASKQVIAAMKQNKRGNIIFIGATASRRGGAKTAAFAPAKAAQKSLAESMARHLGPCGVHVALVIVDGIVDTPATRKMKPEAPEDAFIRPADLAEVVMGLAQQHPSTWSSEIEIRPFREVW